SGSDDLFQFQREAGHVRTIARDGEHLPQLVCVQDDPPRRLADRARGIVYGVTPARDRAALRLLDDLADDLQIAPVVAAPAERIRTGAVLIGQARMAVLPLRHHDA